MSIELPNLPFAYDALEPFISDTTLRTHHDKHHRAYVDKVNSLVSATDLRGSNLDEIMMQSWLRAQKDPSTVALFNNAAQAWNHTFYWSSLQSQDSSRPQSAIAERIQTDFGDHARFAAAFKAAATGHFGSGWAWLIFDGGALRIVTTANADNPIMRGHAPLLVIDVWEHAYYLDHHERRAAYVAGVVDNLLNWEFANRNLELALQRSNTPPPSALSQSFRFAEPVADGTRIKDHTSRELLAKDIMSIPVISVEPDTPVAKVAALLSSQRISGVPVIRNEQLVGVVNEMDLLHRHEIGTEDAPTQSWWARLFRGDQAPSHYVKRAPRLSKTVSSSRSE